jgi:hypothetical protein
MSPQIIDMHYQSKPQCVLVLNKVIGFRTTDAVDFGFLLHLDPTEVTVYEYDNTQSNQYIIY